VIGLGPAAAVRRNGRRLRMRGGRVKMKRTA
jgi:hypothetical protein